jgi:Zn finger protein HypA/HybF involved in hydrogenase expression
MHELQATRGILDVAWRRQPMPAPAHVLAIDVVIGEMTSIVDDSVQFYFDVLSRDTWRRARCCGFVASRRGAVPGVRPRRSR